MVSLKPITLRVSSILCWALLLAGPSLSPAFPEATKEKSPELVTLECRITQNLDLILMSDFGEPPQIAVWLEQPETNALKTIYVTRRAGTGEWKGKLECPASLPQWFSFFRKEFNRPGYPRPNQPLPDGISGATCKEAVITAKCELPRDSQWICWVEVNLSADFNPAYPRPGESLDTVDSDLDGQPSLLYRGELSADPGAELHPEPWAYSRSGTMRGEFERDLTPITTAKDILTSITFLVR